MSKFKIGDQVRIINYGHPMWATGEKYVEAMKDFPKIGNNCWDVAPQYIGRTGIIDGISGDRYSLDWIAWMNEDQLELVL